MKYEGCRWWTRVGSFRYSDALGMIKIHFRLQYVAAEIMKYASHKYVKNTKWKIIMYEVLGFCVMHCWKRQYFWKPAYSNINVFGPDSH